MPRNDFTVDEQCSPALPANIRKIIEKLVNEGSKDQDVFVLKNEKLDLVFCLVRWKTDLFDLAYAEKDHGILDYRGHIFLRSTSDLTKGVSFSYWQLVAHKDSEVLRCAEMKMASY